MAARAWKPGDQCLYRGAKVIRGVLTTGTSGAVTSWVGYGIASVTRNSTGRYTFVLEDPYKKLMGGSAMQLCASANDITVQFISEDVDNTTQSSRTIVVLTKTGANAADMTSGSKLYLSFYLTDTNTSTGPTL